MENNHNLNEEIYETEWVRVFASHSAYEVKNRLFSLHTPQRVYIDENEEPTLYLVADAYSTIHAEMVEVANEQGGYELNFED